LADSPHRRRRSARCRRGEEHVAAAVAGHPMLQVGYYFGSLTRRVDVHECPVCKTTDAGSWPGTARLERGPGPKYRR
jgi:hypothetical protein